MKKIILLAVILVFVAIGPQAHAAFWDIIKPKAKTRALEEPPKAAPSAFEANRKIEARARESLAAKDWMVYLTSIEGKKAVMDMDVLVFSEGKFTSKGLSGQGYATSKFTITVSDNGTVVWETAQTTENGDMAAWRGQLEGEVMKGVLSLHALKGNVQDYYFTNRTDEH